MGKISDYFCPVDETEGPDYSVVVQGKGSVGGGIKISFPSFAKTVAKINSRFFATKCLRYVMKIMKSLDKKRRNLHYCFRFHHRFCLQEIASWSHNWAVNLNIRKRSVFPVFRQCGYNCVHRFKAVRN